jgi:hypothetical protein
MQKLEPFQRGRWIRKKAIRVLAAGRQPVKGGKAITGGRLSLVGSMHDIFCTLAIRLSSNLMHTLIA